MKSEEAIKQSSYYSKSNFGKKRMEKKLFCRLLQVFDNLRGSTLKALIVMGSVFKRHCELL